MPGGKTRLWVGIKTSLQKPATIAVLCLLGYLLAQLGREASLNLDDYFAGLYPDNSLQTVSACVAGLEQRKQGRNYHYSSLLMNKVRLGNGVRLRQLKLYSEKPLGWLYGQCWFFQARLRYPSGLDNPGVFDYRAWLYRQGVDAMASLDDARAVKLLSSTPTTLSGLRNDLSRRLQQGFPGQKYIQALLIADRSGFDEQDWQTLKKTGLVHLFAISGLHIGLIAVASYAVFRMFFIFCLLYWPMLSVRQWSWFFSLLPAGLYVVLAGANIPALRAFLMLLLLVFALLIRRARFSFQTLLLVALLMLWAEPASLFDASFQLSFVAVFAVLVFLFCQKRWPKKQVSGLLSLARLQLFLLVLMAPVLVLWTGGISFSALLLNMVFVPLFGLFVMPLLLFSLVLQFFPGGLELLLWKVLGATIEYLLWAMADAVFLEPAYLTFSNHYSVLLLLLVLAGVFCLLQLKGKELLSLVLILFFMPLWFLPFGRPEWGHFRLSILDVGQGSAAVLQTHRQRWLIDAGPAWASGGDAASRVILPFLRWSGIQRLDAVLLSHYDLDHSGGLETVLQAFYLPVVYAPRSSSGGLKLSSCYAGQQWLLDGVRLEVLHPSALQDYQGNNSSCVLKVSSKNYSVLLPGDIEKAVEFPLAAGLRHRLASDVLVSPHHGSQTSSSWAFLSAVDPSVVVISAGRNNPFRHPHQKILQRYRALGISVLNTAGSGAVLVDSKQAKVIPWHEQTLW